jgi:rhodanese-related sulfurtransferase
MKTKSWILGAVMLASASTAALAGGKGGCPEPTQACLDQMATDLKGRGWVGIEMEPTETKDMRVTSVIPGSPAEKAGLVKGDVILGANGTKHADMTEEKQLALRKTMTPGSSITYMITRDGAPKDVVVVLGQMPEKVAYQIVGHHMLEHATGATSEGGLAELTPAEVTKLAKAGAHVYDANNAKTRSQFGVVPGAKLLASSSEYDLAVLPKSKSDKLIFYCANPKCTASDAAAKRAIEAGYEDVAVMRSGIAGWKEAGEKTSPAPQS